MEREREKPETEESGKLLDLRGAAFDSLVERLAERQLQRMSRNDQPRKDTKKSKIKRVLAEVIDGMFQRQGSHSQILSLKVADLVTGLKLQSSDRIVIVKVLRELCDDRGWKGLERLGHTLLLSRELLDPEAQEARRARRLQQRQEATRLRLARRQGHTTA